MPNTPRNNWDEAAVVIAFFICVTFLVWWFNR